MPLVNEVISRFVRVVIKLKTVGLTLLSLSGNKIIPLTTSFLYLKIILILLLEFLSSKTFTMSCWLFFYILNIFLGVHARKPLLLFHLWHVVWLQRYYTTGTMTWKIRNKILVNKTTTALYWVLLFIITRIWNFTGWRWCFEISPVSVIQLTITTIMLNHIKVKYVFRNECSINSRRWVLM